MSNRPTRGRSVQSKNKSSNGMLYAILGIVAVLGLSALAFLALNNGAGGGGITSATPLGGLPEAPTLPHGRTEDGLYYIGKADAPVIVTEYADYQ